MDNLLDEQTIDWMDKWTQSFNSNWLPWNKEWTIYSFFFFWKVLCILMPTWRKGGRHPNLTCKIESEKKGLEVKSLMDGSKNRRGEHHQTLSSVSMCVSFDLKKSDEKREKMTYSKAISAANRADVYITDDKCVSSWYKLKYRKNNQKALVYNYSDESLVQYRSRCP